MNYHNQKSYRYTYQKYIIIEYQKAMWFLKATLWLIEDVFTFSCDMQDVSSIFGVDLFCHSDCISGYSLRYKWNFSQITKAHINK